jgi:hypothetical protein
MNLIYIFIFFILFFCEKINCSMWNPLNWFRSKKENKINNIDLEKKEDDFKEKNNPHKNIEKKKEENNLVSIKNQLNSYKNFLNLRRSRFLKKGERRRRNDNRKSRIKPFRVSYNK